MTVKGNMMNNSIKGALLSGLIFPGFGQVILKRYRRGFILMFTVFASLMVIAIKAVQHALAILETLEMQGGTIDMEKVTDAAAQAVSASDSAIYNIGLLLIVACWIFGIIDAYRIGREKDRVRRGPAWE